MSILWWVKNDDSQGFPLTKLMAVNTGLARLRRLRCTANDVKCEERINNFPRFDR